MNQPRILLVEDNPITRKMVRFALEKQHFGVSDAPDGATAIRLFASERIALVLQDLMLPDMDGFDLVAKLRAIPGAADVPILAFSGFLSKLEEARVSAAGFDDVISKPIEPSRLVQIVRAYLPSPEPSSQLFGRGRRVIVVDDDSVQRKLACFRLTRLGFETTGASDGVEALEMARRSRPDAIVADVMMPRLDGFGLCVAIRKDEQLATLPVVLMTNSYVEEADRVLARHTGASEFVLRTPEMREVIEALRVTLDGRTNGHSQINTSVDRLDLVPTAGLERERAQRVMQQLERQVSINAGVAQRCATLSAEIAVLTGISEAITRQQSIDSALREILAACFDAGGISIGALYLIEPDTSIRVHTFGGSVEWSTDELHGFFGHLDLLRSIVASQTTMAISASAIPDERTRIFLADSRIGSALVVPLVHANVSLGALVMLSNSADLNNEDRIAFATGVANQISVTLALAKAFADKDASERRATEHADQADAANRAKSEFLAIMSHELRTPLNAIGGHTQLLSMELHGPVTAQQRDTLSRIERSQRRLLGLIDALLNFTRIEAGTVAYDMSPVQLNEAVADAASMLEPQFMEKALAFEIRLPSEPLVVWADSEKLQQILLNLLSNAIKFTPPEGQIMFEVTEHCADGDGPELVPLTYVRISDTGLGIPEEKLSSIFEPFVQVDGSLTRTVGGVGLGLAISRDLARGMGGDIYVRSIMGKGSTFTLTLRAWSHSLHN